MNGSWIPENNRDQLFLLVVKRLNYSRNSNNLLVSYGDAENFIGYGNVNSILVI